MALIKVGALWLHEGKKGKFMAGEIEVGGRVYSVLVFKNDKQKDGQPDYSINVPDDRDGGIHGQEPKRNYQERSDPQDREPTEPSDDIPWGA